MFCNYLRQQVLNFIETFRVVEERQIKAFFADQGRNETDYVLKQLLEGSYVFRVPGTTRLKSNLRLSNVNNYDSVIDALDVMTQLRSNDINWYALRDIPFELEFCVDNNSTMFTVSVFDRRTWVTRYEQTKRLRTLNLPIGEVDPRKHIAVVSDEALIEKVAPLGFDMYVRIKDRNTGELEKWSY